MIDAGVPSGVSAPLSCSPPKSSSLSTTVTEVEGSDVTRHPAPPEAPSRAAELRAIRAEDRAARIATAEEWLSGLEADGEFTGAIPATALFELAEDDLGDEIAGRTTFYAIADRILGPRVRIRGVRTYRIGPQ
ncbi:hypothetical protein EDF19_0146 [Curtobacterium sp. PhB115]|nr:hypothetical protein EDF19_0146 [Curtobacterium sp. PhB115]